MGKGSTPFLGDTSDWESRCAPTSTECNRAHANYYMQGAGDPPTLQENAQSGFLLGTETPV